MHVVVFHELIRTDSVVKHFMFLLFETTPTDSQMELNAPFGTWQQFCGYPENCKNHSIYHSKIKKKFKQNRSKQKL
jgi:hypothetical protein